MGGREGGREGGKVVDACMYVKKKKKSIVEICPTPRKCSSHS
jgi:hypothetical protein